MTWTYGTQWDLSRVEGPSQHEHSGWVMRRKETCAPRLSFRARLPRDRRVVLSPTLIEYPLQIPSVPLEGCPVWLRPLTRADCVRILQISVNPFVLADQVVTAILTVHKQGDLPTTIYKR